MGSLSNRSRCESDSIACCSSELLLLDEIRSRANTMETSRLEPSERIAALELENERLRIEVESSKIETDATNASNRGLKNKIAELFVEAQISFQERRRLESALTDADARLSAAENSCKRYEAKLHDSRAKEESHRTEIETYEEILRRRQRDLVDITTRCERLEGKCVELASRHKKEKRALSRELETLRSRTEACKCDATEEASSDLLRYKLEEMEKFSKESVNRLRASEQRLANSEISRNSLETVLSKYRRLLTEAEENMRKLEAEKSEMGEKLEESRLESRKMRDDNEKLQISVLSAKRERIQVEEAIVHLRSQLDKMIDRYKSLKTTNVESQRKLSAMQDLQSENKHLKLLLYAANNSLFKKLTEEKQRVIELANRLQEEKSRVFMEAEQFHQDEPMSSMRDCLGQALERNEIIYQRAYEKLQEWQDLEARSKSKVLDESIDEGYGDGSIVSTASTDLSSSHSDSELIKSAVDVLSRSKNFMAPLEETVEQLRSRLRELRDIGKE